MEKLKSELNNISKLFGYELFPNTKNFLPFLSYIKSISKPDLTICQKEMKYGYICLTCQKDPLGLICPECFDEKKHEGHKWEISTNKGFCDCGDGNIIKKEGFCSKHKGYFNNYEEMMNYVKNCFEVNLIEKINVILNNIFMLIIQQISIYYNNSDINNKNNIENEIFNMLDIFIFFYTQIKENNSALFYLIIFKFIENFPYETNHKCFNYDFNNKTIKTIPYSSKEKHKCICPFFQILVNLLLLRKTKYNDENFFAPFMTTIQNKLIVSLSFMHTFPYLFSNDNFSVFYNIIFQLCSFDFIEIIYQKNNIFFFEEFLLSIYNNTIKKLIELKQYDSLFKLINSLKDFIEYFPNKEIIDKIKLNFQIHGILIDIICLIHNVISFETLEKGNYNITLLNCEFTGLIIISHLSHLFDFNNKNAINYIFNKLIEKILLIKQIKENINNKSFTPFITIYRAFSIFLNRFCFYYSVKNNIDLLTSFEYFKLCFPQLEDNNIFLFLFQELLSTFSFLLYVDKFESRSNMQLYHINYFSERIFILADITLMKYLLTTTQVQNNFNIKNILTWTDIFNSNNFLNYLDIKNFNRKNKKLENLILEQQINLKYINSLLKFLFYIIRDNSSMIFLAFSYCINFRMQYTDEVLNILLQNDKNNVEEIIKNKIYILILSSKNNVTYNNISNYLDDMNFELFKDLVDNILQNDCKSEIFNNTHFFSIKKEKLAYCDIDYCYEKGKLNDLINYLNQFQTDFNMLNTYISSFISIEESLSNKICNLFFNRDNVKNFLSFYKILIASNKYPLLTNIFFFDFSKILCFYIELKGIDNIERKIKTKLNEIFNKNKVNEIKYIEYIKRILQIEENIRDQNKLDNTNKINNIKLKLKNKLKQNGNLILQKYIPEGKMEIEEEIKEICHYCKKELENDLCNYNGIICNLTSDYFINLLSPKFLKEKIKSRRFFTCKHKIHFNCFFQLFRGNNENNKNIFKCPVCLKESNLLICDFTSLIKTDNNIIIKGMKLDENNLEESFYFNNNDMNVIQYMNNSFANINKIFFENYCSKLFKKKVVIDDLIGNNLIEEIFNYIIYDFDTFCLYYTLTSNKEEQIIIFKNILYTFRYLCKTRIVNSAYFLMNEFNTLYKGLLNLDLNILNNINISDNINKFIILLFILYDLNEENKKQIESMFTNNILILYFFAFYINNKQENLQNFFENKNQLQKVFEIFKLKFNIYKLLFNSSQEDNIDFNSAISFIKNSEKFLELINKYKSNTKSIVKYKKEKYLEIPKLKIIELPNNYNNFLVKYMNINCINCKERRENYYICLFCGAKLCLDKKCISIYKEKKYNSIYVHSKICAGGKALFITSNSCISYVLKNELFLSKKYIYLNSFGENYQYDKSTDLKSDYILNEVSLKENIQMYIDMNFKGNKYFFQVPEQ